MQNSDKVLELVSAANSSEQIHSVCTYDCSTLYTHLTHNETKECTPTPIKNSFQGLYMKYTSIGKKMASHSDKKPETQHAFTEASWYNWYAYNTLG